MQDGLSTEGNMKYSIFALAIMLSTPALAEKPIGDCGSFVKGVAGIKANPNQNDQTFAQQSAFAMGVYFGQAGGYTGTLDADNYVPYVNRIHSECSKAPDKDFAEVALNAYAAPIEPKDTKEFQPISYTDLKLDFAKMLKKKVAVSGILSGLADSYFLKGEKFSTNNILIKTDALDRDTRKFLLSECGGIGCDVTVRGIARKGMFGDEINAQSITPN